MNNNPIGIFDSGIGGLTVLKKLKSQMPNERYIYLGDTKNFPYGEKTENEIISYTRKNIKTLISMNAKIIIIACGTATSQALDIVKNEFSVPIIGIIEPTIKYISRLKLEKIGVIATTGTIRSKAWENNITKKYPNIKVINQACPLLAGIAEEGKVNSKESLEVIHKYMKIFEENSVDTIILGCTHYPIYSQIIKKEFNYNVNLINVGDAVAEEVKKYIEENNMENDLQTLEKTKIILSKNVEGFNFRAEKLLANIDENY